MKRRSEPVWLMPGGDEPFPDPTAASAEGLVAIGADLSVGRLLAAYRSGIFPWFDADTPPLWWSPDPRCVILPETCHVPRSAARLMKRPGLEVTWDRAFRRVMELCAEGRADGTWIVPEMVEAYCALATAGHARSVEVWSSGELVGGLYGVHLGGLFAAESMFRRRTDMSKVALVSALRTCFAAGIEVFDVQFCTPHLARFGAIEIRRADYLERVARLADRPVTLPGP